MSYTELNPIMEQTSAEVVTVLRDLHETGGAIQTRKPAQRDRRPGLISSVYAPASIVGLAIVAGTVGVVTLLYANGDVNQIKLGWGLLSFGFAFGLVAAMLLPRWWNAQVEVKTIDFGIEDDTPTPALEHPIQRVEARRYVGLRAPWLEFWAVSLAHVLYNEDMVWTGGDRVTREMLAPHVVNINARYQIALFDLEQYEWIDGEKTYSQSTNQWEYTPQGKTWTEKAKQELMEKRRLQRPPANMPPIPPHSG